jgi:hypothetical protein
MVAMDSETCRKGNCSAKANRLAPKEQQPPDRPAENRIHRSGKSTGVGLSATLRQRRRVGANVLTCF